MSDASRISSWLQKGLLLFRECLRPTSQLSEEPIGEGGAASFFDCHGSFDGLGACGANDTDFSGNSVGRKVHQQCRRYNSAFSCRLLEEKRVMTQAPARHGVHRFRNHAANIESSVLTKRIVA